MVKNPPETLGTWVHSLGWEDSLEKGTATHSSSCCYFIYNPIFFTPTLMSFHLNQVNSILKDKQYLLTLHSDTRILKKS